MVDLFFPSSVLRFSQPEHLKTAKEVLAEYIARVKPNQWNVCQSESMLDDKLDALFTTIANTSFDMLSDQGYNMVGKQTKVAELWGQEFLRTGQHIEHIHGDGVQITGFYFVNVPKNSSVPIVFDPRAGKKQISMRQNNPEEVTFASEQIMLEVKAGDFMLFNAWLPHGFTRHESDEPFQFIHFNVAVENAFASNVEIV
jgi:uncharacterized protein (TIGR02466 family)